MALLPKQARSATMAIVYITVEALIDVWTAVYYTYAQRQGTMSDAAKFSCAGFFFSGLVLLCIGLLIGKIGRAARRAEVTAVPDQVVTPAAPAAPAQVTVNNTNPTATPTTPRV